MATETDQITSSFEVSASNSAPLPDGTVVQAPAGTWALGFAKNNLVAVAVGPQGNALKTVDGGDHWFHIFQGPDGQSAANRPSLQFPAPWYYLSWIFVGLIAVPAFRKPPETELATEETIANLGVSDRPLEPADADSLGFRNLALSISRFLRNEKTIAPITLAITGDWGTGKSSIMNLLRRDLASRGFRPIWFNAWHNQTEDDLFATILQSIRKQGVPQWWNLDYLPFRLRLLGKRWWSRWPAVALLLGATGFLAGLEWDNLQKYSLATFIGKFKSWDAVIDALKNVHGTFWTLLVCVLIAARELYRGLRAFGVDPGSLLATKSGTTSLAALEKQTALRQGFAEELHEVTEALGQRRRIVLFIDDLDRCMPENIRVVLEAVNFIVTSGECFVILGLARRPVEAGVGLSFKDVAAEMTGSLATGDETAEELSRRKRWQFSREYLDKLINIEIPARPTSNAHVEDLVLGSSVQSQNAPASLARLAQRAMGVVLPVVVSLALILGMCSAGVLMGRLNVPQKQEPSGQAQGGAGGVSATRPSVSPATPPAGSTSSAATYTLEPATALPRGLFGYSLPLLGLAVLLFVAWRALSQSDEVLVKDSPAFRKALEIWDTLIVQTHATPRSTKRFMNRVRCLAMRLRPFSEPRSRWKTLFNPPDAISAEAQPTPAPMPESMLVALSAVYDIAPEFVRNDELYKQAEDGRLLRFADPPRMKFGDYEPKTEAAVDARVQSTYADALEKHRAEFPKEWPPTDEQRVLFLNMCADVTVRG